MRTFFKVARRSAQASWRAWSHAHGRVNLWLNGASCGPGVELLGPAFVENLGELIIGARARIVCGVWANPVGGSQRTSIVVRRGARLVVGEDVGASNLEVFCWSEISIGARTLIGGGCRIYDSDFHPLAAVDRNPDRANATRCKPIHIGDNVFIGGSTTILKGVSIGSRAVIGAGSVVTRSVPSDEIWAGNPARLVRALPRHAPSSEPAPAGSPS